MTEVLERIGYRVEFRDQQTCCGQPAFNTGYREEARRLARHFLAVFDGAEYVVVPSGSCAAMISHHYEQLFPDDPKLMAAVQHIQDRTWEFTRFLIDVARVDDTGASFPGVVTYHDSCHALRELKIKDAPRRLLANVRGLELREMDAAEECCGFGGTFSVKFPEVSGGMARTKIDSILRTKADTVVSADASCLMQLEGALRRAEIPVRGMHIAEVLASR